jgi:hypothetical protein
MCETKTDAPHVTVQFSFVPEELQEDMGKAVCVYCIDDIEMSIRRDDAASFAKACDRVILSRANLTRYIQDVLHNSDDSEESVQMLKYLMTRYPERKTWEGIVREMAAEYLVTRPRSLEQFLTVINPNMVVDDEDGSRLIHVCVLIDELAEPSCIRLLIEHGADPNSDMVGGETALSLGLDKYRSDFVEASMDDRAQHLRTNLLCLIDGGAMPARPCHAIKKQKLSSSLTAQDPISYRRVGAREAFVYMWDQDEVTYVYDVETVYRLTERTAMTERGMARSPMTKKVCHVLPLKAAVDATDFGRFEAYVGSGTEESFGLFDNQENKGEARPFTN